MKNITSLEISTLILNLIILASIYNCISRKKSVNAITKGNIPMHAIIFRCGWDTKSLHIIFSYVFTSMSNDRRYGKALDHQFYKASSDIYGSVNQTLDGIQTESDKVQLFVNSLFIIDTGIHHNKKLKRILSESGLRFHHAFICIIGNEPSGKYNNPSNHPSCQKYLPSLQKLKFLIKPIIKGRIR